MKAAPAPWVMVPRSSPALQGVVDGTVEIRTNGEGNMVKRRRRDPAASSRIKAWARKPTPRASGRRSAKGDRI